MKQGKIKILGIETSCDETSVAVVEGQKHPNNPTTYQPTILSNIISSQIDLHAKYGGVVPEVAARAHMENIIPAIKAALKNAGDLTLNNIDVIAVTIGPGLMGSLLVGINTAKTLAFGLEKPIVGINHLEGHIYANFVREKSLPKADQPLAEKLKDRKQNKFPLICLIVSGGHTNLVLMKEHLKYQIIGETLDDAAGEAFDKVGKLLNLPYPGGPNIEKAARKGNSKALNFPRALIKKDNLNFSFSGLKTAVLREVKNLATYKLKNLKTITDLAASFQAAVIDVLVEKTLAAARKYKVKTVMLAGGVAANEELKRQFNNKLQALSSKPGFLVPPKILCTDNAAMIASVEYFHFLKGDVDYWQEINVDPNLKLKRL